MTFLYILTDSKLQRFLRRDLNGLASSRIPAPALHPPRTEKRAESGKNELAIGHDFARSEGIELVE